MKILMSRTFLSFAAGFAAIVLIGVMGAMFAGSFDAKPNPAATPVSSNK